MKTLFKSSSYEIMKLFYNNRNSPLHLREISRLLKLNESTVSSRLNDLVKNKILKFESEANLKKFQVNAESMKIIFPLFDNEKLEHLPLLRKNAIKDYLKNLKEKPILMVVFGSTSRGNFSDESDIDILEIYHNKVNNDDARNKAENLSGIKIQCFSLTEKQFNLELIEKKDNVIQTALKTGFPVFNEKYFYEVISK